MIDYYLHSKNKFSAKDWAGLCEQEMLSDMDAG